MLQDNNIHLHMKYIFLEKKGLGTYPAGALIYYICGTCLFVPREVKKILRGFPYSF